MTRLVSVLFIALVFLSCDNNSKEGERDYYSKAPNLILQTLKKDSNDIQIFLCGDVMTGRGIDQALQYPGAPRLYESYVKNAKDYLRLAERKNGKIPIPVPFDYIWKDALKELKNRQPDLRIINLETSITTSDMNWPDKAVHYRMNPANIPCLTAANIDGCVLANNHVLDWGYEGLAETLKTLASAGIETAGAGENETAAGRPAIWELKKGRVLLFSFGTDDSGVPEEWAAKANAPGVNFLKDFSPKTIGKIKAQIESVKKANDVVIFSIHWGSNWGYQIPASHREFAHRLIGEAGVDVIYGHSSHHFRGIEVYRGKLILYGCGDFFNDYEGIGGEEQYRGDLTLMYFPTIHPPDGRLVSLEMVPLRIRHFRLNNVSENEALWIKEVLNREGKKFGTSVGVEEGTRAFSLLFPNEVGEERH